MISWAGRWTWTPSATPLQPTKWNAHFWIMFNFCWLAGLVYGLLPHLPPLSSQKNEILIFGLHSTSDDRLGWLMDGRASWWTQTLSTTPHQPKKWNAHFWIMFNFWWSAGLVDGLKHHLPPLSSHKIEMLVFGLRSTSDDRPGYSMDLNPIHHPSPAKKWNAHFGIMFKFWWSAGVIDGLEPHLPPLFSLKMKCLFLDYIQLLMISWPCRWTQTPSSTLLQPKKWYAHFSITFNIWWLARLVNGLKSHTPTLSSQNNDMLIFLITLNFWWLAGLVDRLEPHLPPLSNQQNEMLIFGLCSTSVDWLAGLWMQTPSATPLQPKKWNTHFWIMFNFWWSARLVEGLESHLPPLFSQKNEMLIFGLHSTSDDQLALSMDSNSILHPSPAKKMKYSFFDYIQLLMIG